MNQSLLFCSLILFLSKWSAFDKDFLEHDFAWCLSIPYWLSSSKVLGWFWSIYPEMRHLKKNSHRMLMLRMSSWNHIECRCQSTARRISCNAFFSRSIPLELQLELNRGISKFLFINFHLHRYFLYSKRCAPFGRPKIFPISSGSAFPGFNCSALHAIISGLALWVEPVELAHPDFDLSSDVGARVAFLFDQFQHVQKRATSQFFEFHPSTLWLLIVSFASSSLPGLQSTSQRYSLVLKSRQLPFCETQSALQLIFQAPAVESQSSWWSRPCGFLRLVGEPPSPCQLPPCWL